MQWQLVLEGEGQGCSNHIPSLDFSPLRAYQSPGKALVMKGLQRLPEVLEDAPSTVSDIANKRDERSNLPHQPVLRNLPCMCFFPGAPCQCWLSPLSCVLHQCSSADGRHKAGLSFCVLHAAPVPCWPTYGERERNLPSILPSMVHPGEFMRGAS